jgi:hypothetical protein
MPAQSPYNAGSHQADDRKPAIKKVIIASAISIANA